MLKCRIRNFGHSLRVCRYNSTSANTVTHPIDEAATVIRHLQFTKKLSFENGLKIQEKFARAQLDLKSLQATIVKKKAQLQESQPGSSINEYEDKLLDNILQMKPNPFILTFEFEPTYSGGKRLKGRMTKEQIERYEKFVPKTQTNNPSPKYVQVERGGQVTFHGPGQMVAYIILDLKTFNKYVARNHVCAIQKSAIETLKNMPTHLNTGNNKLELKTETTSETGVWTSNGKKIASIGVHVRRSITSHGICINVCPDLSYLNSFEMCGLPEKEATSILKEKPDSEVSVQDVAIAFSNEFAKSLGIHTVERVELENLDID